MKKRAGVTLLELLLAVSLLGLLSAGILTALHTGVNAMGKANARLMDNRRMVSVQQILDEQIAGFIPVMAGCLVGDGRPPIAMPFFQGEPRSMRFVSSFSLGEGWRGLAQVLEFQVIPGENGQGVRLVVNEHTYTGPLSAGAFCLGLGMDQTLGVQAPLFRPILVGPQSFVLADRLASCRFSYREVQPAPEGDRWVERWILPRWPSAVRIDMVPLAANTTRILPMSITEPIRITALPGMRND
jgi:prepilin-type N-terminal cleavage/methylation domain-containing protein